MARASSEAQLAAARAQVAYSRAELAQAKVGTREGKRESGRAGELPGEPATRPGVPGDRPDTKTTDHERRLSEIERKLDQLIVAAEHAQTRPQGPSSPQPADRGIDSACFISAACNPGSAAHLVNEEYRRRKANAWATLTRDGFICRYDTELRYGLHLYIELYRRYVGPGPSPEETEIVNSMFGPRPERVMLAPEEFVRRLFDTKGFGDTALGRKLFLSPAQDPNAETPLKR